MIDLQALLQRLPADTAKTLVEQARLTTPGMREHIYKGLLSGDRSEPGVMAEPVIEGAFPWLAHPDGWDAIQGTFRNSTIDLLKSVSFPPYSHQVKAWTALRSADTKSVIVSSGTGSGKTECFLSPLVDHLMSLSDDGTSKLGGVRAIMLYPLNALINSQEERLSKWLKPFDGNLRYCLYNGATPNEVKAANETSGPEKVADRKTLRADPPPILVTNITMLEYMLLRREDAAILNRSRGKLDYIILDEAHTYIGAQAAELSLLLRRVAAAFGKSPKDIRYVATSATIGDGNVEGLQRFLADLAGVPTDQVEVVLGARAPIGTQGANLDPISLDELRRGPVSELQERLFEHEALSNVRTSLRDDVPLRWSAWKEATKSVTGEDTIADDEAVLLLSRCVEAVHPTTQELLLPSRLHLFHKTMPGIWVCPNSDCSDRPQDMPDWKFGAISRNESEHCGACGSILFEWVSCRSCGDGALLAEESELADRLQRVASGSLNDDFLQELRDDDEADESDDGQTEDNFRARRQERYLLSEREAGTKTVIDRLTGTILDIPSEKSLSLVAIDNLKQCPHCQEPTPHGSDENALRSILAGAPYLVRQIVPTVLPLLSARSDTSGLPMGGRSMITFTDARQGTAKHAQTLQIAAEREFVRGFLYHVVHQHGASSSQSLEKDQESLDKFLSLPAELKERFTDEIEELKTRINANASNQSTKPIEEIISELAANSDVRGTMLDLWSARSESLDSSEALAEFLLLRELARRPKWAASGETLGLFRVVLPPRKYLMPQSAGPLGVSQEDWEALLQLFVTHFLRQNQMISVRRPAWLRYAGIKGGGRFVVKSARDVTNKNVQKAWPSAHFGQPLRTALVSLLSQTLNLSIDDRSGRDQIEEILAGAFQAIMSSGAMKHEPDGWRLDWTKLHLTKVKEADICPVTRLPLQAGFLGKSIYRNGDGIHLPVERVEYPSFPFPNRRTEEGDPVSAEVFDSWLQQDEKIEALRSKSLWDNRTDRAVRLEGYYRSAEHSAQISQPDLQKYEDKFKSGAINILNCSTTMEMGVDIGEVEAVLLTNAPPAVANYKQRVGRAGRRGQSLSLGITICKDKPLDRMVAENPIAYLTTSQSVPRVSLESTLIAQRHVNAWVLAKFFTSTSGELLKLTVGNFFGLGTADDMPPVQQFISWIDESLDNLARDAELATLVYQTPLPSNALPIESAREMIIQIAGEVKAEWEALGGNATTADNALARAQNAQRNRVEKEYLLSALSGHNFLPAYGFPTGVVQFWTETSEERRRRESETGPTSFEDRRFISRGMPSRQRSIAIHEYAPGSEIVINGLLRKSAGVTLNWQRPVSDDDLKEVQSLRVVRFCENCGALRSSPAIVADEGCPACGSDQKKEYPFLTPAGFTVDTRAKVSDQSDGTEYNERPQALVAAISGEWRSLPDPTVGQFRTSPDGLVFEHNPGPHGFGYAICLECGRAEAEKAKAPSPPPSGMVDHKPLRWTPNAGENDLCPGASRSFSLQRNLSFGDEIRTGVFELQLANVTTHEAAITVAMALREATARQLGIEPTEMGVSAVQTRDRDGSALWTATLYDRTNGGAGFATQAGENITRIIRDAADKLDCGAPGKCGDRGATRICPKCVLQRDTQALFLKTDRQSAFDALTHASNKLALPTEVQVFGTDSTYVAEVVQDALRLQLERTPSASLYIKLDGAPEEWDLDGWNLRPLIRRFAAQDGAVGLIVDSHALESSSTDTKLNVAMWALRNGVSIFKEEDSTWPQNASSLIKGQNAVLIFGALGQTLVASEAWGTAANAPLVSKRLSNWEPPAHAIPVANWLGTDAPTPVGFVKKQLDGDVSTFGKRFRHLLGQLAPELSSDNGLRFREIRISDRYIYNPLSVRLYSEIVGHFADAETELLIKTQGPKKYAESRRPYLINHDWQNIEERNAVLKQMFSKMVSSLELEFPRQVPHGRTIELIAEDGQSFVVILDQGVGSWRVASKVQFDFFANAATQASQLGAMKLLLSGDAGGTYVAVIPSKK